MNKTKIKNNKIKRTFRKIKNINKTRQIKKKYNRTIRGGEPAAEVPAAEAAVVAQVVAAREDAELQGGKLLTGVPLAAGVPVVADALAAPLGCIHSCRDDALYIQDFDEKLHEMKKKIITNDRIKQTILNKIESKLNKIVMNKN